MLTFLTPSTPVLQNSDRMEVRAGATQPQYNVLPMVVGPQPNKDVLTRWSPTPEQRLEIMAGADIFLIMRTFGMPITPVKILVGDAVADSTPFLRGIIGLPCCERDHDSDGNCDRHPATGGS